MNRVFPSFGSAAGPQLGPFERQVLGELWSRGSATVRELIEDGKIHQAYTTVMTTMDRLYKNGLLDRAVEGIRQLLGSGDTSSLPLSYLVEALSTHDAQLLDELQLLVERKRRELKSREQC